MPRITKPAKLEPPLPAQNASESPDSNASPVRTPAELQDGGICRKYYAPTYLPSSEIRLYDILGFDGVAAIPADNPHRFDHPILVQAIATHEEGCSADIYVLSLVGSDPVASVIVNFFGPSYHVHSRELLSDEETAFVINFIEAVFDGSFTEIPDGSAWRSRDRETNVIMPFSSGKTWADVKAK